MCFLTRFLTHLLFSQKFCFRNSVVQFSRIDARNFLRQLCYYITHFSLCQALFSNFFKIFLIFFVQGGFIFCFFYDIIKQHGKGKPLPCVRKHAYFAEGKVRFTTSEICLRKCACGRFTSAQNL